MTLICAHCGKPAETDKIPGLQFNSVSGMLTYKDKSVYLSPFQMDFFEVLFDAYPRAKSWTQLHTDLYGDKAESEWPSSHTLSVHASQMRRRFREAGIELQLIGRGGWEERNGVAIQPL